MSFHFLTAKSVKKLHNIPEHDKGEGDKETKGAAKVWDKGVKGVDEVLSQTGGAQRPVGDDRAKGLHVPEISSDHFPLHCIGDFLDPRLPTNACYGK